MTRSSRREERQLMTEIYAKAQRRRAAKKAGVPQVGIVFVVDGKAFQNTGARPSPVLGAIAEDGGGTFRRRIRRSPEGKGRLRHANAQVHAVP